MGELPFAATTPISVGAGWAESQECRRVGELLSRGGRPDGIVALERNHFARRRRSCAAGDRSDPSARPDDPRGAGLFHTAFLLPTRADLGRWVKHAIEKRVPIDGASDHLVSEALYLTDPEGNGIEIYADRAKETMGP